MGSSTAQKAALQSAICEIGLETSSFMPLLEVTTRTLPLQKSLSQATDNVKFIIDQYSLEEAKAQIDLSYQNALVSITKAEKVAKAVNADHVQMSWIAVKSLAEPIYGGRHETLRWADAIVGILNSAEKILDFFSSARMAMSRKREIYIQRMTPNSDGVLRVASDEILSYWATPEHVSGFCVTIKVAPNPLQRTEFYELLLHHCPKLQEVNVGINDMNDLYHLYSLNKGCGISEIWTCNQKFVKRHEEYLASTDAFASLFDQERTKIVRIK